MPTAAIAAGIGAVGSIAGAFIGKGGSKSSATTASEQSHTPWGPQGQAIESGLNDASGVYNDRTQQGPYQGSVVAGLNYPQQRAINTATGFSDTIGQDGIYRDAAVGGSAVNALGQSVGTANSVAGSGIGGQNGALTGALSAFGSGQKPVVNSGLGDALNSSAMSGAQSIGGFNAGLGDVMARSSADPTQKLAGDAQTFMNGGATQAMLNNVNGQIDNTLNETTVPGLNRMAAMGGDLNSSRAGMAEAMANRDASLAKGNADAQIMNNSFNTGLGVASSQHTAGLNSEATAATSGLAGNSNLALGTGNQQIGTAQTQIGAANSGLSQDTSHGSADANARLSAAGQLTSAANTGVMANSAAGTLAKDNLLLAGGAGQIQQQGDQAALTNTYDQYKLKNEYQQGVLTDYMNTVTKPSGYYDVNGRSTTTSTPQSSLGSLVAGGATALGSQFLSGGAFNSKNKDGTPNQDYVNVGKWFGGGGQPATAASSNTPMVAQSDSNFNGPGIGS